MVDKEYPEHFPKPYGDIFPTHGERIVAAYHEPPPAIEFQLKIALSALPQGMVDKLVKLLANPGQPIPQMTISFDKAWIEGASMQTQIGEGAFLTLEGKTRYDSVVDIRPPGR